MEYQQRRGVGPSGEMSSWNPSKVGWINRHTTSGGGGGGGGGGSGGMVQSGSISSNLASLALNGQLDGYNWRLTKAVLKNGSLNLYRPPTDLSIKSFDPLVGRATSGSHKRIASTMSTSTAGVGGVGGSVVNSNLPLTLSYKGFDVHPDLVFDSQGKIANGSLEAICHNILFGNDDEFLFTAVLTIPLLGDVVTALEIMKEYVNGIRVNHSTGGPNPEVIANRVKMIIDTMLNNFKGMLLNNSIHASLQQLADSVGSYNDQISTALKLSIYQKHQRMNKMLSYTREDTEVLWSMHQKVTDSMSERLQSFLAKIDASVGNEFGSVGGGVSGGGGGGRHHHTSSGSSGSSYHGYSTGASLNIPPDLFVELTSTDFLATQISSFHLKFYKQWSPAIDISLLFKTNNYSYHRYNPLIFDSSNQHFLGALIVEHILSSKYAKLLDNAYRGRLLTSWITLGNTLKSLGDLVGWIAIVSVICSPNILRLRQCWSYVPLELRETVGKDWGHELFELDRRSKMDLMSKRTFRVSTEDIGVSYPKERSISFFGDLIVRPDENISYKLCEERVNRVKTVINSWEYFFDRIPQNDTFGPPPQPNAAIQKLLHGLLVHNYENPQLSSEEILKLSLSVEPPRFGNYLKFHYAQQSPLMTGSYLPLIFTDANPSYKLFTKSSLISALSGIIAVPPTTSTSKRLVRSGTTRSSEASILPSSASINNFYSHSGHTILSTSSTLTSSSALKQTTASNLHRSNSFPPSNSKSIAMTTGVKDIDFFSREFVAKYASQHILMKNIRDVLNMGAKLYHINDDIVVKSLSEEYSRPSSMIEAPSKHLSISSRRVSTQFTSTVSPRASLNGNTSTDFSKVFEHFSTSVNVVVKSANLERLVDILVLGVNGFASFVNKQDIEGKGGVPEFRIDMNVHTLTFFATFRSFCSPLELLSSLRKRFIGAKSAAISIVNLGNDEEEEEEEEAAVSDSESFPDWNPNCAISLDNRAWGIVAQIQIGVLEACHLWLLQYFSDFADNAALKEQFLELIDVFNAEINNWKVSSKQQINEDYSSYLESMEIIYKKVRNLFYKKSYRPNDVYSLTPAYPVGVKYDNLPISNGSNMKLEKFVDDINIIVSEYLAMINIKEWIELFETFELQSSEINGFFNYSAPNYSNDEDMVIQDIFTFLESLYREVNGVERMKLVEQFPQALQSLFQLRHNIISYLQYQIYDPSIHKDDRVQRMVSILKMVGICKTRMRFLDIFPKDDEDELIIGKDISTSIPSFLESCIITTILRPESRLFANSWIQASKEINRIYNNKTAPTSFTSLDVFIPIIHKEDLVYNGSRKSLCTCIGWTIERMFEIVCYVPNMSVENCSLINFDKRRFIYNLITNVSEMKGEEDDEEDERNNTSNSYSVAKRIAYIVNPDKSLYHIDRRSLKESSIKDTKEYPRSYSKNKVFTSYITLEADKIKRDNRQKEFIERQYKDLKKSSKLKYAGLTTSTASISDKKTQRSRFGGLLKAVRPISMAFSGTFIPPADRIVSRYDLPEIASINDTKCKLLATINLAHCELSLISNQEYLFRITDPSSEVTFQALNEQDLSDWIRLLTSGKRFATLRAQHQPSSPNSPSSPVAFTKVFGVPISVVCERESRGIPMVVDVLLDEIESRGLDEVGLYRVSGSLASVNLLKAAFDSGEDVDMQDDRWFDINTIAGCFKLYLRELSEPLLTNELFPEFVQCGGLIGSSTDKEVLQQLRVCINKLPSTNYNLLKRLLQHLGKVAEHEENNKMKTPNLAIVFSMSFLPSSAVDQMKSMQNVVNTMIIFHDKLFAGVVEADNDRAPTPSESDDTTETTSSSTTSTPSSTTNDSHPPPPPPENDSQLGGSDHASSTNRDSFTEVSAY